MINEEGSVVLKFGMKTCPPCKQLQPILDELKKENEGVEFVEIDAQEERELSAKYNVRRVPKLLFIQDGEIKSELLGLKSKSEIQENINLLAE